jgi:hypothetical protein
MLVFLTISLPGCASRGKVEHRPLEFTEAPSPHGEDKFPNWQFSPHELEGRLYKMLLAGESEHLGVEGTGKGMTGAMKVRLFLPAEKKKIKFKFKKVVPGWLDSYNTSPRKEIAAYEVQKLFLEPEDYVVPTVLPFCVPRERHQKVAGYAAASLKGTDCVLGLASIWMINVEHTKKLYEESRFLKEPTYAYFMSNFNILTYLIQHRDAREGQWLVSKDEKRRQVFSIDNGISFDFWPYNFFRRQWDVIHLPALRKDSIERLRRLQRKDLDHLGVLAQLEMDENGILMPVPPGANLDPNKGAMFKDGTVQFGLTESEIDNLWQRIQTLIAQVDSGRIAVF